MLKKVKYFLWSNRFTKRFYRFLWHWKHNGIRVAFSYFKSGKLAISSTSKIANIKNYHYEIIRPIWTTFGATEELMQKLDFLSKSMWCWEHENPRIWLIYICCLLETNQLDRAKEMLERYISIYSEKNIFQFLPVASLANTLGIHSEEIDMAAVVFGILEDNRKNFLFQNIIKGKTVAVVGNAGCELGLKRGVEIDSHDIVIRFNNFSLNYVEDYGSKTDIWVRGGPLEIRDREDSSTFKLILWAQDYWHVAIHPHHLEVIYNEILANKQRDAYIWFENRKELYEQSKILKPTSGCFLLWMIYKYLGSFNNVDIYGFSFPFDNSYPGHYYDDLCKMNIDHNMYAEKPFLRKLYFENGGRIPAESEMSSSKSEE